MLDPVPDPVPPAGPFGPDGQPLLAEDLKLVVLARATRARTAASEGAAVRDDTGRTYAAGPVNLRSLRLSALQVAVAVAAGSGAEALEAAAVVTDAEAEGDPVLDELNCSTFIVAAPDGTVRRVSSRISARSPDRP